jgi:hypothetical protein
MSLLQAIPNIALAYAIPAHNSRKGKPVYAVALDRDPSAAHAATSTACAALTDSVTPCTL